VKPSTKSISDVRVAMEARTIDDFRMSANELARKESYPMRVSPGLRAMHPPDSQRSQAVKNT